jgi:hypothetical protein
MFQHFKARLTATTAILWLIVLTDVSYAQIANLIPTYTVKKGLPSSSVNHILQSPDGATWIGTENGIKIINSGKYQWIEKQTYGKGILQIGFLQNEVYIGSRDSLQVINLQSKKIVASFSTDSIGIPRKIRNIQNAIWITTNTKIFKFNHLTLSPINFNLKNEKIFDVTNYKGIVTGVTYPKGKIVTYTNGTFIENVSLSNQINPSKAPLLTTLAKGDTLVVAGDCYYAVYANKKIIDQNKYPLRKLIFYNYAIWDIAFVDNQIYFATGDTHNLINGGILKAFPTFNDLETGAPYLQTLFYNHSTGTLWAGSLHEGVYEINGIRETIQHNGLKYAAGLNVQSYYLYDGDCVFEIKKNVVKNLAIKDTRLITTIGDSTFIVTYLNLIIIPKNGKVFSTNYGTDIGRLYTHAFRLGDSLYAYALYKPTIIINLKNFSRLFVGDNKIINIVEKQNDYILSHNQGIGFSIFTKSGLQPLLLDNKQITDINDCTITPGNQIVTLAENKLKIYKLDPVLLDAKLIKIFNFSTAFTDFTPKWITQDNQGHLYAIADKGIVVFNNHTPVTYLALSNAKITTKPKLDIQKRLIIEYDRTVRFMDVTTKIKSNTFKSVRINVPRQLEALSKPIIKINTAANESNQDGLYKLEIIKDTTPIFTRYSFTSETLLDTALPNGRYQIRVSINNVVHYTKTLEIITPWEKSPLFKSFLLLLVGSIIYLILRNSYNKRIFSKKIISNKLEMIQQNLNPHFVFNSLNLIYSSILDDKKEMALQTVRDFSKLHRNFLERSKEKQVSIASELDFIESYLAIEALRFKENISISHNVQIDPDCDILHTLIPPNILQPLVENGIKYGILGYSGKEKAILFIGIQQKQNQVILYIENPFDSNAPIYKGTGMGISIVEERIKLYNQENKTDIRFITRAASTHFNKGYRVEIIINS